MLCFEFQFSNNEHFYNLIVCLVICVRTVVRYFKFTRMYAVMYVFELYTILIVLPNLVIFALSSKFE